MTQIILGSNLALPETSRGKYRCYPATLSQQVDMISGRRVLEVRGHVQMVEYAYDYMGNALMRQVLSLLRANATVQAAYLPDDGDELVPSTFVVESMTQPVFAFDRYGVPYWHDFSFVLREVRPHD